MPDAGLFDFSSVPDSYRTGLQPWIFDPWARRLLDEVAPRTGQTVLDVASGPGAVASLASSAVGPGGRVVASDLSPLMLAGVGRPASGGSSRIDILVCPADALDLPDASVDVAYCQQGFQFLPDRDAAAGEIRRVLRPGGRTGVAVWRAGRRPEPFETYARVLRSEGVAEPYPGAYDTDAVTLTADDLAGSLSAGGLVEIDVRPFTIDLVWPDLRTAALGILGTSYGPAVAGLEDADRSRVLTSLTRAMADGGTVGVQVMEAVIGTGVAPGGQGT